MSINDGEAWLMDIQGNRIITGKINEVLDLQVNSAVEENPITATIDRAIFVAYVEDSTTITLVYSSAWSADPTLYGVAISGTPIAGDSIVITYVKEELGTITQSNPQTFVSTGWNLFNPTLGYARVVKYEYGYRIEGTYTGIAFSSTESGTQSTITPIDGNFDLPSGATDGYIWVTGAGSDTVVYATHSDWTAAGNDGVYNAYIEYAVNFTSIMETLFPYGLLAVGNVRDEINLNLGTAINRVERMAYTADNLTAARNSGRAYEYDGDYIYIVMAAPVSTGISISGVYTANDHGLEYFTGTTVPVITEFLYGNNLKNKLERDVVTISPQTLTDAQKTQVRTNIGAASQTDVSALSDLSNSFVKFRHTGIAPNSDLNDFTTPGFYSTASSAVTNTLSNCPLTGVGFSMIVLQRGGQNTQVIFAASAFFMRMLASDGWRDWYSFSGTKVGG